MSTAREHPRFIDEKAVEIEFSSREALKEAWTIDISKGGMFIRTESPPPFGTRLTVKFATPHGVLELESEVVHVVDVASAQAFNQPPGVGVQFLELSSEIRDQIEAYVDGVAQRLADDLVPEETFEPLDDLIAEARRIMKEVQASRLYAALEVDPGASRDEIELRVQTLCERFSYPPPDSPPPKVARLELVVRQLERTNELVANPIRRLHYDFHHGHVRVEERRAAGDDFTYLREVWAQAFPDRIKSAKERAERALSLEGSSPADCVALAEDALKLDPFNDDLRRAHDAWSAGKTVQAASSEPPPPATMDLVVAELAAFVKQTEPPTHYELLGIEPAATPDEITKAYFAKSRRFHPDTLRSAVTPEVLEVAGNLQRALNLAYRTLNHPAARLAYNKTLGGAAPDPQRVSDAMMAFEMAKVHLRKGAVADARGLLEGVYLSEPTNPQYAAYYAWSMIKDRNFDRVRALTEGRDLLEKAIETAKKSGPRDPILIGQWVYYLGCVFKERSDVERALMHFEKSLLLNPHLKEARMEVRLIQMRKENED